MLLVLLLLLLLQLMLLLLLCCCDVYLCLGQLATEWVGHLRVDSGTLGVHKAAQWCHQDRSIQKLNAHKCKTRPKWRSDAARLARVERRRGGALAACAIGCAIRCWRWGRRWSASSAWPLPCAVSVHRAPCPLPHFLSCQAYLPAHGSLYLIMIRIARRMDMLRSA